MKDKVSNQTDKLRAMLGMQIQRRKRWGWIYGAVMAAVISCIFAIWSGPALVYLSSGLGLLISIISLGQAWKRRDLYPDRGYSVSLAVVHGILLTVAVTLAALFLRPLSKENLELPRLSHLYVDPSGIFQLRGPSGWDYNPTSSPNGAGVRMKPLSQTQYMGVSEIQILVRELDQVPENSELFLEKMAASLSPTERKTKNKKVFNFRTEAVQLLSDNKGVWSVLDMKRYWIPLRQGCLFGIKNKKYLCSISTSGLREQSTLAKVLCLGLFEKMAIMERPLPPK